MNYQWIPIICLTMVAALCWLCIWTARSGRHIEQKHYKLLCITGSLSYIPMFFVITVSSASITGLILVTAIAAMCLGLFVIYTVNFQQKVNSRTFTVTILMGQGLFPFVLLAVPEIERIFNLT